MPRIVTALFEDRAAAQRALQALMEAGVARDRIALVGADGSRDVSSISGFRDLSARDDGRAALHDLPLPDEDLRMFEAGLRRGHALLSARVDAENMEEAVNVLDLFEPLDLDGRSREWQEGQAGGTGGGTGAGMGGGMGGVDAGGPLGAGLTGGNAAGATNTGALPGMGSLATGTHDAATADLRADEASASDGGRSSTSETGGREEARAGRPGVLDLAEGQTVNPAAGQGFAGGDRYRRELNRTGRVRAYGRDD
jgi:hypothetical protein